jgi:hypothetical protein
MLVVKERVSFAQGKNKSQILTTGLISERLIKPSKRQLGCALHECKTLQS